MRLLIALPLLLALGCSSDGQGGLRDPVNPAPTPLPAPVPRTLRVDYRVTGTIPATEITYFSSAQVTTQVRTDLPWAISYTTTDLHPFIYLAAETPVTNFIDGQLTVQVFIDGVLFREARGSGFTISVAASGEVP
jgi:hypothetical protein